MKIRKRLNLSYHPWTDRINDYSSPEKLHRLAEKLERLLHEQHEALILFKPVRENILSATNTTRAFDEAAAAYEQLTKEMES